MPEQWHQWNFPLKPILDQALRWHASTINIKSSRIPSEWKAAFDEFQKQIGYRFVLKRLEYPSHVARGAMAPLSMWWFNAGVAPIYRAYALALAIGDTVVPLDADVRHWLPGDAVVEGTVAVPRDLAPGRYPVRVALARSGNRQPAIRLAIAGRQDRTGGIRSARSRSSECGRAAPRSAAVGCGRKSESSRRSRTCESASRDTLGPRWNASGMRSRRARSVSSLGGARE